MGANKIEKDDSKASAFTVGFQATGKLNATRRSAMRELGTQEPTSDKMEMKITGETKVHTSYSTGIIVEKKVISGKTVPNKRRTAETKMQMSLRKQRWSWC